MIVRAKDSVSGIEVSAEDAIPGRIYRCPYCNTKLHVCKKRYFVRYPDVPEHSNDVCIAMNARPPQDVEHKVRKTHKNDIFGKILRGRDLLDRPEPPDLPPHPLPLFGDQAAPLDPHLSTIETDDLTRFPALGTIVKVLQDLNIDNLNCEADRLETLGITQREIMQLAADIDNPDRDNLSRKDIEVLERLKEDEMRRRIVRPICTLRQFENSGLIHMEADTQLADCKLIDLFLSYSQGKYRTFFCDNYMNLGSRILYCRFTPLRELDEGDRPSLRFSMFWNNPENTNVTLYINFLSDGEHTAREYYEFFVRRMLEQRTLPNGTLRWVPRGATEEEIQRGFFEALVFGQWTNVERCDKRKDERHYISLRTNYFNARQIVFTKGYNQ